MEIVLVKIFFSNLDFKILEKNKPSLTFPNVATVNP